LVVVAVEFTLTLAEEVADLAVVLAAKKVVVVLVEQGLQDKGLMVDLMDQEVALLLLVQVVVALVQSVNLLLWVQQLLALEAQDY
jgi:hypothetical protein